ncbi:hypothetical protein KP79_PYT22046 [Mizuhopecten yessoensis]|uniref:Uncharacterized protein n=1 Tax=Mizuhopecten yessoensis TaxID=6573 RepID=A0A210PYS6_MIZYE|nr:hypothetical protein KP79_PYT22046 [Mizuhopecten yessoensis]
MKWNERRRMVELSVLSEFLEKGCHVCGWMLKLSNTFQERHYDLGSLLYIKYAQETCGTILRERGMGSIVTVDTKSFIKKKAPNEKSYKQEDLC